MKMKWVPGSASALLVMTCLAACSPQQASTDATDAAAPAPSTPRLVAEQPERAPPPVVCSSCGVVRSVSAVTQQGTTTGTGAVIGGIVGGVAGNQVGGGSGRKIATVAGVIGGALLGNNIEQNRNTASWYEIVVDMEGGGQQMITVQDPAGISPGAQVSVQGGNISLR